MEAITQKTKNARDALNKALFMSYSYPELMCHVQQYRRNPPPHMYGQTALRALRGKLQDIRDSLSKQPLGNENLRKDLDALLKKDNPLSKEYENTIEALCKENVIFPSKELQEQHIWQALAAPLSSYPRPESYIERIVNIQDPLSQGSASLRVRILRQFVKVLPYAHAPYAKKKLINTPIMQIDESIFAELEQKKNSYLSVKHWSKNFIATISEMDTLKERLQYLEDHFAHDALRAKDYDWLRTKHNWNVSDSKTLCRQFETLLSTEGKRMVDIIFGMCAYIEESNNDFNALLHHVQVTNDKEFASFLQTCHDLIDSRKLNYEGLSTFKCFESKPRTKKDLLDCLNSYKKKLPDSVDSREQLKKELQAYLVETEDEVLSQSDSSSDYQMKKCADTCLRIITRRPLSLSGMDAFNATCNTSLTKPSQIKALYEKQCDNMKLPLNTLMDALNRHCDALDEDYRKYVKSNCYISYANDLAMGAISTSERTLSALYVFAFAYNMKYAAEGSDPLNFRSLVTDYYSDNLLRYLSDVNATSVKEPSLALNPKNYAQTIFLYYLNRQGSPYERFKKAVELVEHMDELAWKSTQPAQETGITQRFWQQLNDYVLQLKEADLEDYIVQNYNICRGVVDPFTKRLRPIVHPFSVENGSASLNESVKAAEESLTNSLRTYTRKNLSLTQFLSAANGSTHLFWDSYLIVPQDIISDYFGEGEQPDFLKVLTKVLDRLSLKKLQDPTPSRTKILALSFWACFFDRFNPDSSDYFVSFQDAWDMLHDETLDLLQNAGLQPFSAENKILFDIILAAYLSCIINKISL